MSTCHHPGSPLQLLCCWVGDQTHWFTTPTKWCRTSWTSQVMHPESHQPTLCKHWITAATRKFY